MAVGRASRRVWWAGPGLNRRPRHFQCRALPAELPAQSDETRATKPERRNPRDESSNRRGTIETDATARKRAARHRARAARNVGGDRQNETVTPSWMPSR